MPFKEGLAAQCIFLRQYYFFAESFKGASPILGAGEAAGQKH